MGPILTILIAPHEREIPSDSLNKELSHSAHDLHRPEAQSEAQNQGKREDHGTVNQPRGASPERISNNDRVGEDVHGAVQSAKSGGERPCADNTLACIDPY